MSASRAKYTYKISTVVDQHHNGSPKLAKYTYKISTVVDRLLSSVGLCQIHL